MCFLVPLLFSLSEAKTVRHWYYEPQWVNDIQGRAFANPTLAQQPYHQVYIPVWGLGDAAVDQTISEWNAGDFTGFYVPSPISQYQRGADNAWFGSTTVQLQGYSAGFQIHSWSGTGPPQPSQPDLRSAYYTWQYTIADDNRPWGYGSTSSFCYGANLQVPTGYYESGACGYLSLFMHLTDTSTGHHVWICVSAYDSRGMSGVVEGIMWDVGTATAMVLTYFDSNRQYLDLEAGSQSFTGTKWPDLPDLPDWRYYACRINTSHVAKWVADLNDEYGAGTFSTDPADYRLNALSIGPEIYIPNGTNAHMGCSVDSVMLFTDAWVANTPPTANPVATPDSGYAPLTVNFTANASDADSDPLTYKWDFDGNGTWDSTAENPSFVYSTVGAYTVDFEVSDGEDTFATTLTVTVSEVLNNIYWDGGGSGDLWSTAANWNPDGVPSSSDYAEINSGSALIDSSITTTVLNTDLSRIAGGTPVLTMTGGSLTNLGFTSERYPMIIGSRGTAAFNISDGAVVSPGFLISNSPGSVGVVNMSDGSMDARKSGTLLGQFWEDFCVGDAGNGTLNFSGGAILANNLRVPARSGTGRLNMTGGTIDVTGFVHVGADSDIHLDGGTITGASVSIDALGVLDIRGGKMILDGDKTVAVQSLIDDGLITGYDDSANVLYSYNGIDTMVWDSVPEFTGDSFVNLHDFAKMAAEWLSCSGTTTNVTGDGCVNMDDLMVLADYWLQGV